MTTKYGRDVDSQRSKFYAAEGYSTAERSTQRKVPVLATVADIEAEIWAILRDPKVVAAWPGVRRVTQVTVHNGGGSRRGYCHHWGPRHVRITMPLWCRNEPILLHEVAHFLSHEFDPGHSAGHGPEYAATYVKLVHIRAGAKTAALVKARLKRGKVRVGPKRTMTPAQLEAARKGMDAMRERAAAKAAQS